MSTAYYKEQVREVIHHLTSVLDGKFSLGRYNEIFRTSINIASNLGKPYENNATNYNATFAKSLKSFFEDLRDDFIRVVPEDDQDDQFFLAFPGSKNWAEAISLSSDKENPFVPPANPETPKNPKNPFSPEKTHPKNTNFSKNPLQNLNKPNNRQNGRFQQRNRRSGPTKRSQTWAAQKSFEKPSELLRGVHFDRSSTRHANPLPPPSTPHMLPPPSFLPTNFSHSNNQTVPCNPIVHTLAPDQLPRFPFVHQNPGQLNSTQQIQYITALQKECKKMHDLARL